MTEDESIMSEKIIAQERQIGDLQGQIKIQSDLLSEEKHKVITARLKFSVMKLVQSVTILLAVSAGIMTAGYAFYKYLTSSGFVTHCFVDTRPICYKEETSGNERYCENQIILRGHVDWQDDRKYGAFKTMEEALAKATQLGCQVK